MKKSKVILASVLGVVALLVIVGLLLPSKWQVTRSVTINAAPEEIYPLIANLQTGWPQWSAFDSADPEAKYSFSGPEEGEGATRTWDTKKMGDGLQRIVRADSLTGIEFELEMNEFNIKLNGTIAFTPAAEGQGTVVTWTDAGEAAGITDRFMALGRDKNFGTSIEKSLAKLKELVEGQDGSEQEENSEETEEGIPEETSSTQDPAGEETTVEVTTTPSTPAEGTTEAPAAESAAKTEETSVPAENPAA